VRRSGERLRFGGQLAALVQLQVHVRTGPPAGPIDVEPVEGAEAALPA